MELTHLRYFLTLAETEHVTKSANILCVSQPSLTKTMHNLENELGVPLFKNVGRNIALTEYGKFFYKKLKPLYNDIQNLPQMLYNMAENESKTIRLNVLAASSIITKAAILYKKKSPNINIDLIQNAETSLYDIKVQTFNNYKKTNNANEFCFTENIYLAVPNNGKYANKKSVSVSEIKNEHFIGLYDSKQFRNICNHFCEALGISSYVSFESDNVIAVKDAIREGLGVGFWPEFTWGSVDKKIQLLKIENANFTRDLVISTNSRDIHNTEVSNFFEFLKDFFKKL